MSLSCLRCGYPITEPLCASCIINGIKIWFYEQTMEKEAVRKIDSKFKHLLKQIESLDYTLLSSRNMHEMSMMKCIRCKKEMSLVCFYCVNNQASLIVKDNLRGEDSMENFQESFNTELYDYELDRGI